MFSCARIYVEVDLEKGLPKAIPMSLDNLKHVKKQIMRNHHSNVSLVMNMVNFPEIARIINPKL
jgi:hypothetical protein